MRYFGDTMVMCNGGKPLPQAVDPSSFMQTMKDLDGNPIDVSVQQDAQGFLLDLFDKMEVCCMG